MILLQLFIILGVMNLNPINQEFILPMDEPRNSYTIGTVLIYINGDAALDAYCSLGNGSEQSPFIIENQNFINPLAIIMDC